MLHCLWADSAGSGRGPLRAAPMETVALGTCFCGWLQEEGMLGCRIGVAVPALLL